MPKLNGPYEVFDIGDGEAVQVRVIRTEPGEIDIHPGYGSTVKTVPCLRLHLQHPWVEGRMPYIDITSTRLKASLEPLLQNLPAGGKLVRIIKHGQAPSALFSVELA